LQGHEVNLKEGWWVDLLKAAAQVGPEDGDTPEQQLLDRATGERLRMSGVLNCEFKGYTCKLLVLFANKSLCTQSESVGKKPMVTGVAVAQGLPQS
jgi:hypothetical protein